MNQSNVSKKIAFSLLILLSLIPLSGLAGKTPEEVETFQRHLGKSSSGNKWSLYSLGLDYDLGRGVEKNLPKALELYRKAAEAGLGKAQLRLAYILDRDDISVEFSTKHDPEQAILWFKRAAESGEIDALIRMSEICSSGEKRDIQKAWAYYKLAQIFVLTRGSEIWQIPPFETLGGFTENEVRRVKSNDVNSQVERMISYEKFMKPLLLKIRQIKDQEEKDFSSSPFGDEFDYFEPDMNTR